MQANAHTLVVEQEHVKHLTDESNGLFFIQFSFGSSLLHSVWKSPLDQFTNVLMTKLYIYDIYIVIQLHSSSTGSNINMRTIWYIYVYT